MARNRWIIFGLVFVLYTGIVIFISRSVTTSPGSEKAKREEAERKIADLRDSLELNVGIKNRLAEMDELLRVKDSTITAGLNKSQIKYEIRIKNIPLLPDDTLLKLVRERLNFK